MKVFLISSAAVPTPPLAYGGLESIAANLVVELARRGHEVTLVTVQGTKFNGHIQLTDQNNNKLGTINVIETGPPSIESNAEYNHYNAYRKMMEEQFCDGNSIILDFTWAGYPYMSISGSVKAGIPAHPDGKIIHVHHGMVQTRQPPMISHPRFSGVSQAHAQLLSATMGIPVRHFHNGIQLPPESEITGKTNEGFLLSLNRFSQEKGIHSAIDVAISAKMPIICCGDDRIIASQEYNARIIQQCKNSNGLAKYYGLVDNLQKIDLLKRCKAVISCTEPTWMEAFGMYATEAMAYGKPVLAVANGGLVEIIDNGKTGFLAPNPEALKAFVPRLDEIEPQACYDRVRDLFTVEKMADKYEITFNGVLNNDVSYYW